MAATNGSATGGEDHRIPVVFYFDYICPFCYVGAHRLQRITQRYPVAVEYRFVEIHPDSPAGGRPVSELGYPPEQWRRMNEALTAMLEADGLLMAERTFTTNSRQALLLARTVLQRRPGRFLALHNALFHAYFVDGRNIGETAVLESIAADHDVGDCLMPVDDRQALAGLLEDVEAARSTGLTGVPTLIVGDRAFPGAVSMDTLAAAMEEHTRGGAPGETH
ncbi:DsbA family protein [Arhodomonas sp. KWT2]|uniref:DsbA family oxidoreductase n=1 Tax=Arhodomonas sp. KWT2 TaxID=3344194 RepID=UPI0035C07B79